MQIKDMMKRDIVQITPETTLDQIAVKMKDADIGVLPVVEDDRLVGVVTDRDIVVRGIAGRSTPLSDTKAHEIMSRNVLKCREDQSLQELSASLQAGMVRRMIVTDSDDHLVGMVSLGDLARSEEQGAGTALSRIARA